MEDNTYKIREELIPNSRYNWFENRNCGDITEMAMATLRIEKEYVSMSFHSRLGKPLRGGFWLDISSFENIAKRFLEFLGYKVEKGEQSDSG
jgi:hypothetical protein